MVIVSMRAGHRFKFKKNHYKCKCLCAFINIHCIVLQVVKARGVLTSLRKTDPSENSV